MAISNAFAGLVCLEAGKEICKAFEKNLDQFPSIGSTQRAIHRVLPNFNLRKISSEEFRRDKFRWLANCTSGLFLLRMRTGTEVDHCVVTDGAKSEIVDGDEKMPMRLYEAALRACGGGDARNLYIAEVRELHNSKLQ